MEMNLTGRMMDATEAERANLVARVVPLASLMDEAMKLAETIASMSLPSVLLAKEALRYKALWNITTPLEITVLAAAYVAMLVRRNDADRLVMPLGASIH